MRRSLFALLATTAALTLAGPAHAAFHFISIREVAPNPAGANSAYVELQMYESGQNLVAGHKIQFYTATGSLLASYTLSGNVANGDNQRTVLIGDEATPGSPDFVDPNLAEAVQTYGPGGAVCWDTIDCVSWGNFNNTSGTPLPSPTGNPAPAIPNGSALQRSIASGCATLLEAGDDTNDSLADFALAAPTPRNNSVAPTERACGGGGSGDNEPPQTTITKGPAKESEKTTAKFKFESSESGSTFECKLDKQPFKSCKSPRKYKNLAPGKHKFKVAATDAAGNSDKTPAKLKFKVLGD